MFYIRRLTKFDVTSILETHFENLANVELKK